jgi:hypothetical protein
MLAQIDVSALDPLDPAFTHYGDEEKLIAFVGKAF